MKNARIQEFTITAPTEARTDHRKRFLHFLRVLSLKQIVLLVVTVVLLFGSTAVSQSISEAQAANPGPGRACTWYRIRPGDTLSGIARYYRTTIGTLAYVNYIRNVNLIFAGQSLCIPYITRAGGALGNRQSTSGSPNSGLFPNGTVRWYDYSALEQTSQNQVGVLLHQVAAHYGLPANLLEAIAWQESGWNQHVIARDGGIGTMQIMPYTAMGLDTMTGVRYDPYKTLDNIELGAIYLHTLWIGFHGDLTRIVSAYNEGGWNVLHRGIFNWGYVNNVLYLMHRFN